MKEPARYKLTDAPETKRVKLTPLPPLGEVYPDAMSEDIYIKPKDMTSNEDNSKND